MYERATLWRTALSSPSFLCSEVALKTFVRTGQGRAGRAASSLFVPLRLNNHLLFGRQPLSRRNDKYTREVDWIMPT